MKVFTSQKQRIGLKGELAAEMFLVKQGFRIIDKNYSTRFGEIDLIATKNGRIHFCEVKAVTVTHETRLIEDTEVSPASPSLGGHETGSWNKVDVSRETQSNLNNQVIRSVSRETFIRENRKLINPFQNVSYFKTKRLVRTAEIYMKMNNVPRETRWQVDGIGVYLYPKPQEPKIEYLPNINII